MTDYERSLGVNRASLRLRSWAAAGGLSIPVELLRDIEREAGDLDAAWAEAEAALPEGGWLSLGGKNPYRAEGFVMSKDLDEFRKSLAAAIGPTPAAALRALAARLREARG